MHKLRKKNYIRGGDRGAALMVAIVIIGILMVFALSLLLVTYTLYASQNKKAASQRNSEAANTLSVALTTELTEGINKNGVKQDPSECELWRYLRFNLCTDKTWPYYNPGEAGHGETEAFRYFNLNYNFVSKYFDAPSATEQDPLSGMEGFPGKVQLCIYWCLPSDIDEPDKINDFFSGQGANGKSGVKLYIEVICETGSQTYVVKNKYVLSENDFGSTDTRLKSALKKYADEKAYNPLQLKTEDGINLNKKWTWSFESRE